MNVGSTIQPNLALIAVGRLTQGAAPAWAAEEGMAAAIVRTAAGNYTVATEQGGIDFVDVTLGVSGGAALNPAVANTVWYNIVDATHVQVLTSTGAALADLGEVSIFVYRKVN